ncbi:MAG TPA: hypothetical protein VIY28_07060 [Pseudonocardiaceae bacterium]
MTATYARNPGYSGKPFAGPRPVELVLVATDEAVNIFGLAARFTARAWLPQVERAAEEVARELVSRAVETTGIPGTRLPWTAFQEGEIPLIEARLRLEYPSLFVEVWDGDRTSPYPLPGAELDEHMAAVQARVRRWDWYPRGRGKVIWGELGIPPQHHTGKLPRRTAGRFSYPAPGGQGHPLPDVETLRQVRDGLARLDSDRAQGAAR